MKIMIVGLLILRDNQREKVNRSAFILHLHEFWHTKVLTPSQLCMSVSQVWIQISKEELREIQKSNEHNSIV